MKTIPLKLNFSQSIYCPKLVKFNQNGRLYVRVWSDNYYRTFGEDDVNEATFLIVLILESWICLVFHCWRWVLSLSQNSSGILNWCCPPPEAKKITILTTHPSKNPANFIYINRSLPLATVIDCLTLLELTIVSN